MLRLLPPSGRRKKKKQKKHIVCPSKKRKKAHRFTRRTFSNLQSIRRCCVWGWPFHHLFIISPHMTQRVKEASPHPHRAHTHTHTHVFFFFRRTCERNQLAHIDGFVVPGVQKRKISLRDFIFPTCADDLTHVMRTNTDRFRHRALWVWYTYTCSARSVNC